jgi:hypothetical protein
MNTSGCPLRHVSLLGDSNQSYGNAALRLGGSCSGRSEFSAAPSIKQEIEELQEFFTRKGKKLPENPGRDLFYEAKYKPTEQQPEDDAKNVCRSGERIAANSIESPGVMPEHMMPAHRQDQEPHGQQNQDLHDANDTFMNCFHQNPLFDRNHDEGKLNSHRRNAILLVASPYRDHGKRQARTRERFISSLICGHHFFA